MGGESRTGKRFLQPRGRRSGVLDSALNAKTVQEPTPLVQSVVNAQEALA